MTTNTDKYSLSVNVKYVGENIYQEVALLLPIYHSLFPVPCSLFPIPDSRFPIPDSRSPPGRGTGWVPIPDSRFPIPDSRFPNL
ncbi:hypothetical protein [Moorena producens]|uniref:hypothetical protein n=1 Tax=Moorena producens TaxID=1155739 RepID=UPI003C7894CE